MFPTDVVIVAGARTPMARYTGAFSEVSAIDLGAHASKAAIQKSGVDPAEFDHAIFGNVMQTSADALERPALFRFRVAPGCAGGTSRPSPVALPG